MKLKFLIIAIVLSVFTVVAFAEDELTTMTIQEAMDNPKVQNVLYEDIALYWGAQGHPGVVKNFWRVQNQPKSQQGGEKQGIGLPVGLGICYKIAPAACKKRGWQCSDQYQVQCPE